MSDDRSYLSQKNIDPKERTIFALDVDSSDRAKQIVEQLGDAIVFYKLGLEMFLGGQYFETIDWLLARNKKIFVDLKFFDVPQTVGAAVKQLTNRGISFVTVHGNDEILKAAVREKQDLKILAVTVLTSLDRGDLNDLGFDCDPDALVLSRAKRALAIGCDGVISSGREAKALRANLDANFLVVTPGIRPVDNTAEPRDDQKRTVDVKTAFMNGADYIVVGRPIKSAPDPYRAACEIQNAIAEIFAGR
ncbi:orotidine-5'-phosphate decarboxylase [Chamaesiphon minutus]|uniref:Orotidine 5'-phosphate decarboxylase n=1 Tax=Chamaesiphon minutus (strain ATCC 27169 / PCC 6605) TaxID=1173020 RepID=K9UJF6_CHAP6|nr:orotidine-5'-phosphate decarboxylase [Chamaesiphon minutus]AFY95237.1 orotidine 5''-phosphate decarboxylase, subfamily 1 [Chamaesiphon minutus PCC 6605]